MQTEWIWEAKANQAIFNRKTQSESLVETRPAQSQACLCTFTTLKRYFLFAPCNYRSFSADVVNGSADCAG